VVIATFLGTIADGFVGVIVPRAGNDPTIPFRILTTAAPPLLLI
jgi:hypothetical protein